MKWYYAINNERKGPVDDQEFETLVRQGTISVQTLVWNATFPDWKRLGDVSDYPGKTALPPDISDTSGVRECPEATGRCSECGRSFPEDDLVRFETSRVCAACKPLFVQKIREGVQIGGMVYAGFWIRFAAKFIDGIIIGMVNMLFGLAGSSLMFRAMADPIASIKYSVLSMFFQGVVAASFNTYFLGKFGATPGKMVCGLKVVTPENGKISYMTGLGRYFAEMLSAMILMIGYMMAGWDEEKRALHDRICNTRVIRTR